MGIACKQELNHDHFAETESSPLVGCCFDQLDDLWKVGVEPQASVSKKYETSSLKHNVTDAVGRQKMEHEMLQGKILARILIKLDVQIGQ